MTSFELYCIRTYVLIENLDLEEGEGESGGLPHLFRSTECIVATPKAPLLGVPRNAIGCVVFSRIAKAKR